MPTGATKKILIKDVVMTTKKTTYNLESVNI